MKLSTATSVFIHYAIEDTIAIVAEAGYDGIDIWGGRPHVYRQDFSPKQLQELKRSLADHGLAVSSFMPAFYRYPHSLSNPNPIVREDSIDYIRQCIDNAVVLEAGIVLVVPDHSLHGQTRQESQQRMIDCIDRIALHAAQYDIKLGIEVLDDEETDLVRSCDDALYMIRTLGYKNLGVVLDAGALHVTKEPLEQALAKLGDLFLQIHVSDNHGATQHNLIPGEGTYDFEAMMRVLHTNAYSGFITLELSKSYGLDPGPAVRTSAERLRSWIQQTQL